MERILITGVNGLLGQKCTEQFSGDFKIFGVDIHDTPYANEKKLSYQKLDITKRSDVKKAIMSIKPHYIINTAAYTNVDGSEKNKELCWKVNVEAVENLAYSASKIEAHIVHLSTDYVFDGKNGPYKETDVPNPLGYYGKSKLASENVLIQSDTEAAIIRTMILYGNATAVRPNFVTWLIDKLEKGEKVTIVSDQFGNPTLADDLARAIKKVIELKKWDTYHISGSEIVDRYTFALEIARIFKLKTELITPIKTSELNQTAPRPLVSGFVLDKAKKELGVNMLNVDESLNMMRKQQKRFIFI